MVSQFVLRQPMKIYDLIYDVLHTVGGISAIRPTLYDVSYANYGYDTTRHDMTRLYERRVAGD